MWGYNRAGGDHVTWHVMNRGTQGQRLYASGPEYKEFTTLLGTYTRKNGLKVLSYCIMPNHYHVLVKGRGELLTKCFQQVDRLWALAHNDRSGQKGHAFQGRFLSFAQKSDAWVARTSRYIHLNPTPRLARKPEAYPWSSYRAYLGQDPGGS